MWKITEVHMQASFVPGPGKCLKVHNGLSLEEHQVRYILEFILLQVLVLPLALLRQFIMEGLCHLTLEHFLRPCHQGQAL
jgi:hypothetical protein